MSIMKLNSLLYCIVLFVVLVSAGCSVPTEISENPTSSDNNLALPTSSAVTATVKPRETVKPQVQLPEETPSPAVTPNTPSPPTVQPTATNFSFSPIAYLKGPTVAFVQNEPSLTGSILLLDIGTESTQSIQFPVGQPVRISQATNQCQLYVLLRQSFGVELVEIDLTANQMKSIFQYERDDQSRTPGTFQDEWVMSPTGNHVAYMVFAGEHYYATSELQDVEILSLDGQPEMRRLTSRSGALGFAWSPDGSQLAYSDYDESGIRQLYHYNINENATVQLTNFTDGGALIGEPMGNYIGEPVWSSDGRMIVVESGITDEEGSFTRSLWVVSITGDKELQIVSETSMTFSIMGWSKDGSNLAVYVHNETGDMNKNLYWIDTLDGQVLKEMSSGMIPGTDITLIGAISGTELWLGYNTEGKLLAFDTLTETIEDLGDADWLQIEPFLSLGSNIGEVIDSQQIVDWAIVAEEFMVEGICN